MSSSPRYEDIRHFEDKEAAASEFTKVPIVRDLQKSFAVTAWRLCGPVAIVSTKYLLVDRQYHYPSNLLFLQLLTAVTVAFCLTYFRHRWTGSELNKAPAILSKGMRQEILIPMIMAGFALSLFSQAILHFYNFPVLTMLFPVVALVDEVLSAAFSKHRRNGYSIALLATCTFWCMGLISADYRLSVSGLISSLSSMILFGCARAAFRLTLRHGEHSPSFLRNEMLAIGLFIAAAWSLFIEPLHGFRRPAALDYYVLSLNLLSTTLSLLSTTNFIPVAPSTHETTSPDKVGGDVIFEYMYFTASTASLYVFFTLRSYISRLQLVAYLGSLVCIGLLELRSSVPRGGSLSEPSYRHGFKLSRRVYVKAGMLLLLWVTVLITNFSEFSVLVNRPPQSSNIDRQFASNRQLDVVISMHQEPSSVINNLISTMRMLPAIADSNPSFILYNKNEASFSNPFALAKLKNETGATTIINVPNAGRESATYLQHIIRNWHNLAKHTMFVQAEVHFPREFYPRIENYFTKKTGFLSLSAVGNICRECSRCADQSGWTHDPDAFRTVFDRTHSGQCDENQAILLTYNGQFIVSGRRIRGLSKSVYEELLDDLVNQNSWAHHQDYVKGREDSLSKPWFGYTVERLWGVIFQCNNLDAGWKCPTLLSKWRYGGDMGDCQCLDET